MKAICYLYTVATVSLPTVEIVGEGDGVVEVCAVLSGVSASDLLISISLVTSDSSPGM